MTGLRASLRATVAGAAVAALVSTVQPSAEAATVEVVIQNYRFTPAEVTVAVGDTVRWVNREKRASHSVLFEAESLPESERLFQDEQWERQFTAAGSYPYRCGPHPEMSGVVHVH